MLMIDLPMPEACDVCPFNYDFCWCTAFGNHDEWEKYSDDWNYHVCDRKTRPEYCPLKEIVRCKDCNHGQYEEWNNGECVDKTVYCDWYGTHKPDWFCADGERK